MGPNRVFGKTEEYGFLKGLETFKWTQASCERGGLKTPYTNFQAPAMTRYAKIEELSF